MFSEIITTDNIKIKNQAERMNDYYRFHAKIYDLSRWTFLFGRRKIIDNLPFHEKEILNVLEIGCGTGKNLAYIARRFPNAQMTGVDISRNMIAQAQKKLHQYAVRTKLLEMPYGGEKINLKVQPDVILFSYCLTMVNPDFEKLITQALHDLKPNGIIAVVDFHNSRFAGFKRWMGFKHVRMDSHLLPSLKNNFTELKTEVRNAYGSVWQYMLFYGKK